MEKGSPTSRPREASSVRGFGGTGDGMGRRALGIGGVDQACGERRTLLLGFFFISAILLELWACKILGWGSVWFDLGL
ncbi:hypothetical protein V6Z11_A05G313900 [Gossypium hirsutum]